jgi:hypothetical protein
MPIQTLLPYDINERNSNKQAGFSVSEALEGLVQRKLQKVQQQNNAQLYQEAWKLDPRQAEFVSKQSEEFQQEFTKALRAEQQARAFDKEINPGKYASQPPSLQETMGALGGNGQQGQPTSIPEASLSGMGPQQTMQNPQRSIADVLGNQPLNPQLQVQAERIKEKRRATDERSKDEAYNYNKEVIFKARESAKRAEQDNHAIEQILKANSTGKLKQGPTRKLLEKFGLEDIFTNTPTQFVAKQIERLATGGPSKFGVNKYTNFLAETYRKGNLSLLNKKDSMDIIGKGIILENKKDEAYYNAMRDIEKEANRQGVPIPRDLADQALERARPEMKRYDDEATKNLEDVLNKPMKKLYSSDKNEDPRKLPGIIRTNNETGKKEKSVNGKWVAYNPEGK